ncbi:MAG TPA: hypothetical protein VFQ43_05600 [Nitrososphaera sp.]|nr:hypothetical protein [Nitrososphaera sp.]
MADASGSSGYHGATEQEAVATWPIRNPQLKLNCIDLYLAASAPTAEFYNRRLVALHSTRWVSVTHTTRSLPLPVLYLRGTQTTRSPV